MGQLNLPTLKDLLHILPQPTPVELERRILEAHDFAEMIHGDRRRHSGELFIEHDRAVAHNVGEIGIDTVTTTAALLHDTLNEIYQESDRRKREMDDLFGQGVTGLVVGLDRLTPYTKLDGSEDERKLEKLRRAILHVVEDDIRILLLRMADSLQDLLSASSLPVESQRVIATEAGEIYAPIANRLGIWSMKWRLEDESFRLLQPELYHSLQVQIAEHRQVQDVKINQRIAEIKGKLAAREINATVKGRTKHIFSIFRKMQRKRVPFEEIYDLRAIRVILHSNDASQCYQVLGIVHNIWLPIPEEFDDYIANPKPNGYRSLHTAVYDNDGEVLEIQIRTRAMDDEAERGIAAHWAYKEGGRPSAELNRRVKWLRQLLIDLRDEQEEDTPLDARMINVDDLSKRIYVFTPQRDLVELPEGATPIDFAYQIHTEVGHRCRGAKVNGKMVPLNQPLNPGDTVSIITAKRGSPSRDWMSETSGYTRSAKTRSKVRQWFRINDRDDNMIRGLEVIERELKRLKLTDTITVDEIARSFKEGDEEDFLAKVGFGDIQFNQVTGAIGLLVDKKRSELAALEAELANEEDEEEIVFRPRSPQKGLRIEGLSGLAYRMANCCMPIPPEPIVGYITRGRGVTVHHRQCNQFVEMALQEPDRVISVDWGGEGDSGVHEIPIVVSAYRRPELAEDIATLVSGRNIKLSRTKSSTNKKGLTTVNLMVQISNTDDLDWLLQKLRNMAAVLDVRRQRWSA